MNATKTLKYNNETTIFNLNSFKKNNTFNDYFIFKTEYKTIYLQTDHIITDKKGDNYRWKIEELDYDNFILSLEIFDNGQGNFKKVKNIKKHKDYRKLTVDAIQQCLKWLIKGGNN